MKKLTNKHFLKRCQVTWGDKYDLSKIIYTGMRNKIIVGCPLHGDFQVTATNFTVNKSGCPICGAQNAKLTDVFISQCKEKHGERYGYKKTVYINAKTKVKIECHQHGEFEQFPNVHSVNGSGCPKCAKVARLSVSDFIECAKKTHGDKYDYSKTLYRRAIEPVIIICEKHGQFEQLPHNHLSGRGCPDCGKDSFLKKMKMPLEDAAKTCNFSGITLIEYAGNATHKSKVMCDKKHVWFTSLSKIQQGIKCPVCSVPGYNPSRTGYVYMLISHDGKYMKIGLSNSPKKRIRTLKFSTPFDFVVRGWIAYDGATAPKIETSFHKKCKAASLTGFDGCSEWFVYDDLIADSFDLQGLP